MALSDQTKSAQVSRSPECVSKELAGISSVPYIEYARRLKSLARRFFLDVCVLEGEVDGAPFRTLIADDGSLLPYFGSVIYPDQFTRREMNGVSGVRAPHLADSEVDLVIIGANQCLLSLYRSHDFYFIPKFVRTFLPVSDSPDVMVGHLPSSAREDIRRGIRKMLEGGFEYEIVSDPSWFDKFYYEMYKPYVSSRHRELARTHDYRHIKSYFAKGFILLVKKENTPVAATVSYTCGSTLCNTYMGIWQGDQSLLRDGVSTAIYYYSMLFAYVSGCTGIDFGNSRPFLSDGPLRYKLKWGMQIVDIDDGIGVYALAAPGRTEQARKFLSRNRFFHLTSKGIQLCEDY